MTPRCICCDKPLSPVAREALATYAHEAWAAYMDYFFRKCIADSDGSLIVPAGYVMSLRGLIGTPYADLPDEQKGLDRDEAAKMIALFDFCFDGWCADCAGRVLAEVLSLRDGKDVGVKVAVLHDWGCETMVRAVVGHE